MLIKITFITISSSTQQALLTITSMFPISGATTNSAESVIVSAMKMDLSPVCQPEKKVNTTGDLYPEEMQELKEMVKELWRILKSSPLR